MAPDNANSVKKDLLGLLEYFGHLVLPLADLESKHVHDVDALVAPDHQGWDLNGGEASFHVERNAGKVVDPIVAPTSEFILPDTGVELGTQPATT